jgi:streptogramin lyase
MNDDRDFVLSLERWLEAREAPVSASRLSEEILAAVATTPQEGRLAGRLRRPIRRAPLRLLALAATLLLAIGSLTALFVGGRQAIVYVPPPVPSPTPTLTPSPTPEDLYPEVVTRIPFRTDTWQVLATGERIWVQTGDVGLTAVDPATGEVVASVPNATWMFFEGEDLWAQIGVEDALVRLDPVTGEELERFADIPGAVAAKDGDTVWSLVQAETAEVIRTDLVTGERLAVIEVPAEPKQIAFEAGSVWVACDAGNALVRIDPETYEIVDTVDVGMGPVEMESGFDSLWVRNRDLELVRVDPVSATVVARLDGFTNSPSLGLSFGGGLVWASWQVPPGIAAIDPATNEVVHTIPLPGSMFHDTFWLDDTLWVTTANVRELLQVDAGSP